MDVVAEKAIQAVSQSGMKKLVMAGGVAANSRLRDKLGALCEKEGIALYCAAYYKYKSGQRGSLEMDASPSMPLSYTETG